MSVKANAEEMRSFASSVDQYLDTLIELNQGLKNQLAQLGQSWRDQEFDKFNTDFEKLLVVIDKFVESAEEIPPDLRAKAEIIDGFTEL